MVERRMIGLGLAVGPAALPGFCSGVSTPLISVGYFPGIVIWFSISAICAVTVIPPYLSCSALMLSVPALLLFLRDCSFYLFVREWWI